MPDDIHFQFLTRDDPAMSAAGTARVQICPLYLVRTATLPVSALHALSATKLIADLEAADALEQSAQAAATAVADALHEAIGAIKGEPSQKAEMRLLIEAKRSVFNGRQPKHLETVQALLEPSNPGGAEVLGGWADRIDRLQALRASLDAKLEAQNLQARQQLARMSADRRFSDSLALVNPELAVQVNGFRRIAAGPIRHKDRQVEASLHQFVTRTATKPSPLSQFCVTSYGMMATDDAYPHQGDDAAPPVARVRVNLSLLARVRERAEAVLMQDGQLPIALNSSVTQSGGRFHFLRTRLRPVHQLAVFSSVTTQGMFSIPRTRMVELLFDILAGGAVVSLSDCVARMTERGVAGQRARSEIRQLMERGFIEVPQIDGTGIDYVHIMRATRDVVGSTGLAELEAPLGRLDSLAGRLGAVSGQERIEMLQEARSTGKALCDAVGLTAIANGTALLYEDTIGRSRSSVTIAIDAALQQALDLLAPVLPLIDRLLPTRLAVREAFIRQFGEHGTCTDVGLFADDIARLRNAQHAEETGSLKARAPIDEALLSHASPDRQREMRQALIARRAAYLHLRRRALRAGGGTVDLDASDLARFTDAVSASARPSLIAAALFLQKDGRGGWVLNQISAGTCQFMSRFIDHWSLEGDQAPVEAARAYLRRITPPDAVLAELSGHDDSTLNLHPCLTDLSLAIPHDRPSGQPRETVTLPDLCIRYHGESGELRLYDTAGSRRLLPTYLGGLSSSLLPSLQQLLLLLGPTQRLPRLGWNHLLGSESTASVRALPEVRIGALVLLRRSWMVPADSIGLAAGASELETFDQIRRWRARHGIPARCFLVLREREEKQWRGSEWSKPAFIDFDSPLGVSALAKASRQITGHLFLSEALPDPAAAAPDSFTSEFILDLAIGGDHV